MFSGLITGVQLSLVRLSSPLHYHQQPVTGPHKTPPKKKSGKKIKIAGRIYIHPWFDPIFYSTYIHIYIQRLVKYKIQKG